MEANKILTILNEKKYACSFRKKKQFIAVAHYKAEKNGDHLDLLIREYNQLNIDYYHLLSLYMLPNIIRLIEVEAYITIALSCYHNYCMLFSFAVKTFFARFFPIFLVVVVASV